MKHIFLGLIILFLATSCSRDHNCVTSPDGRIKLTFAVDEAGEMSYDVTVDGKPFINQSSLGLVADNGVNLQNGFKVKSRRPYAKDQTWTQPWGENKKIRDHYNATDIVLGNESGVELTLTFKVFDDGVGFRYHYRVPGIDTIFVTDELTAFNFAQDGRSWTIEANNDTYELLYRELPISGVPTANTPATFRTDDNIYASIHEAALYDFPEMTLTRDEGTNFKATLAAWPDGIKARVANSFDTPWRTIQIGRRAVDLINSGLILNLNEPCALESTDWIKPAKYVGVWWGMHLGTESWVMGDRHGATTENAKRYIDFAAKNNIEGVLFEGWNKGWETWGGEQTFSFVEPYDDFDIREVVRYAKERGVTVIGHHETGGNVPVYEAVLDTALHWYADMGINILKTGYAGGMPNGQKHHSQYGVRHYQKVVEAAAKHKIMIDAHEPIKETGIRRTYPNMMTREGVRGMEWNAWSEGNPPSHHVTLPFTRMLSGPLDYTPGIFDILYQNTRDSKDLKQWNSKSSRECRVHTTLVKQLANFVILYSPLQMACDLVENYEGHPAFKFISDYDADCDESIALDGEPGDYIAIVRKAKGRYFLGAATNEEGRTIDLPLGFLERGKRYKAVVYADGEHAHWETNPLEYTISEIEVTHADTLNVVMAPGGGQAITFDEI